MIIKILVGIIVFIVVMVIGVAISISEHEGFARMIDATYGVPESHEEKLKGDNKWKNQE